MKRLNRSHVWSAKASERCGAIDQVALSEAQAASPSSAQVSRLPHLFTGRTTAGGAALDGNWESDSRSSPHERTHSRSSASLRNTTVSL
jgi:hypothetical protein